MLVPNAALTVGDKLYEEQILAIRLRRTRLPALDRLEIAMPLGTTFEATPGETCSLTLDGGDDEGGGGEAPVFAGQVTEVTHRGDALHVTAHNGGLTLARYRPVGAFEQMTIAEIIENFCADAGVDVEIDLDAPTLALYAADGRATALREIARLAALAGGAPSFDGDGTLHISQEGTPTGELALRYGRELLDIEIADGLQPTDAVTVVGEGAGAPDAPESRWLNTDFLAGSAPAPDIAARRRAVPELRLSDDTEAASVALAERRSAAARPIRFTTWLMPVLAPGMRIEIADLPAPLALDDCHITQVVSTLAQGGAATSAVWATGRPDEGGGLLGALGGLL